MYFCASFQSAAVSDGGECNISYFVTHFSFPFLPKISCLFPFALPAWKLSSIRSKGIKLLLYHQVFNRKFFLMSLLWFRERSLANSGLTSSNVCPPSASCARVCLVESKGSDKFVNEEDILNGSCFSSGFRLTHTEVSSTFETNNDYKLYLFVLCCTFI